MRGDKPLAPRDMDMAKCVDPENPRKGWRFHAPMLDSGPMLGGMVSKLECGTCGETFLVSPR